MLRHCGRAVLVLASVLGFLVPAGGAEESDSSSPPALTRRSIGHPVRVVNTPSVRIVGVIGHEPPPRPEESPCEPFFVRVPLTAGQTRGTVALPDACFGRYIVVEQVSGVVYGRVGFFSLSVIDGYPTWHERLSTQVFPLPDTLTPGIVSPPPAATHAVTWRLPLEAAGLLLEIEADTPQYTEGGRAFLSGYCVDAE